MKKISINYFKILFCVFVFSLNFIVIKAQNTSNSVLGNKQSNYDQSYVDSLYSNAKDLIILSDSYEEGQVLLNKALAYTSEGTYDYDKFSFLQGKLYQKTGKKNEFIHLYKQIISKKPINISSKHKHLIGLCHYNLAYYYSDIEDESKMNFHCNEALKHYESKNFKNINDVYYIQNDYYFYRENSDSYIYAYKAFINNIREYIYIICTFPDQDRLNLLYNNIAAIYYLIGHLYETKYEYKYSLIFFEIAHTFLKKDSNFIKNDLLLFKQNLAYINLYLKNYDKSESIAQGILLDNYSLNSPDPEISIGILSLLGDIRLQRNDYFQAKIYYEKSMDEAINFYEENDPYLKYNHESLAVINYALKNYNLTIDHYNKAKKLTVNKKGINYLNYTIGIASAYHYIDKNRSLKIYKEALELSENVQDIQKIDSEANIYYNLGVLQKENKSESYKYHLNSRTLYEKSPNNHSEASLNLICLAKIKKEDKQLYLKYIEEAILTTLRKEYKLSSDSMPEYNDIVFPFQLLNCYKTLGDYYFDNGDIDNALTTYEKAKKTIAIIKPMYKYDSSKESLTKESIPIFNKIITLAYQKYKTSNKFIYFQKAYDASEKSKSIHLIDALNNNAAIDKVGVPDSIINIGKEIKTKIDNLEEKMNNISLKKQDEIKDEFISLYTRYNEFIINLENNYKEYYNLKYSSKDLDINGLRSQIDNHHLIIQFTLQDSQVVILGLTKNNESFIVKNIPKKEIEFKTQAYIEAITSKNESTTNQLSHKIYNDLLKEILETYPKKQNIWIIPDGILNHIPFELLSVTEKSETRLIYTKHISYHYTSTKLFQGPIKESSNNKFLGIAPTYINFPKLPFAKKEVEEIQNNITGEILTEKEANLNNFKQHLNDFNIIHFAGHAEINDSLPMTSRLLFSDIGDSIQSLYAHELYNMKTNSNMVALSACNSGVGKIIEGEGNISLARGFAYAGCPSIITTLWPMNDEPTKDIMTSFYQNLKKGYTKSEALRKSKLDYLESGGSKIQAPLYWAGIVIIGSDSPIIEASIFNLSSSLIISGLILLLFTFLLFRKFKK